MVAHPTRAETTRPSNLSRLSKIRCQDARILPSCNHFSWDSLTSRVPPAPSHTLLSSVSPSTHPLPSPSSLSYPATSLSAAHLTRFTDVLSSTGYTFGGRGKAKCERWREGVRRYRKTRGWDGSVSLGARAGSYHCSSALNHELNRGINHVLTFAISTIIGSSTNRLKRLYPLLAEHYDLNGMDYCGQSTFHFCRAAGNFRRTTRREEYPIACMSSAVRMLKLISTSSVIRTACPQTQSTKGSTILSPHP